MDSPSPPRGCAPCWPGRRAERSRSAPSRTVGAATMTARNGSPAWPEGWFWHWSSAASCAPSWSPAGAVPGLGAAGLGHGREPLHLPDPADLPLPEPAPQLAGRPGRRHGRGRPATRPGPARRPAGGPPGAAHYEAIVYALRRRCDAVPVLWTGPRDFPGGAIPPAGRWTGGPVEVGPNDRWVTAYRVEDLATGGVLVYAPCVAAWSPVLDALCATADCVLLDGTFFAADEMGTAVRPGSGQAAMGHLPVTGPHGSLAALGRHPRPRRIYTHLDNTNPLLDPASRAREQVAENGVEVLPDGAAFTL
ncbi:MBL fold metallo-hydrolase [Streptomyces sp. NPDC051636]|uniref:MBL fold metallo-hydrolase n=1 Tax=Streptomyces sp. NPDC051636 TaxID=3365663 RepID=UPI0037B0C35C